MQFKKPLLLFITYFLDNEKTENSLWGIGNSSNEIWRGKEKAQNFHSRLSSKWTSSQSIQLNGIMKI